MTDGEVAAVALARSLTHWEFAPVDLGLSLTNPKALVTVRSALEKRGWVEASDLFTSEDLECIVPHRLGVFQKNSTVLYVPTSGYAVARYELSTSLEGDGPVDQSDVVYRVLRDRVRIQRRIEDEGSSDETSEVHDASLAIRSELRSLNRSTFRCTRDQSIHQYSFSVFWVAGEWSNKITNALQDPRSVGFSIMNAEKDLPSLPEFWDLVQKLPEGTQIRPVQCSLNGDCLFAGWSTAVLNAKTSSPRGGTLTLCEFRVQSTWLAAYNTAQLASSVDISNPSPGLGRLIGYVGAEFTQIVSRYGQRLGPNSPDIPSRFVEALVETSELAHEVNSANRALDSAYARVEMAESRHNAKGKRVLELFALIFASSSLAQLLFPLPLSLNVLSQHSFSFAAWSILNFVGVFLILRQR